MYKILLVEDDFALAAAMKAQLENDGHAVCAVRDFRNVTAEFAACAPQLVLMDIMLPFRDGYYWTGELRRLSSAPIVFISSASDSMNIVMAVNMGGDDFIAKPVDARVLCAKVRSILRRAYEMADGGQKIDFCGASLSLADYTVTYGGSQAELTKNELRILQVLLENRGRIVSRDTLMTRLWQSDLYVEENTLTVNVSRLRKKLEDIGLSGVILTKPGSGYIVK